ncbi:kelch-like protein [Corallococcus sp. BB11-1]|uniref:RCC1 domain-containing protein n=1 Tax=Corallococcus sp. BB11-1 TaxID=2996783 RepID=UPI002270A7A5|nr:kelch-like protein [Corallococcus sp. BB11-1]MCY1035368.1 kelch-like protein [Corallococcus sp. BB11-1]
MHQKRSSRLFCLAIGLVVALVGCRADESAAGAVQAVVMLPQGLSASDVVRVDLTVSGEGMTSRTDALVKTGGRWGGVLGKLPEGTGRTFHGEAFDAQGTLRYVGDATSVSIHAGQTTAVALVLQEVNAPAPFDNAAPVITSLVASPSTVGPGGEVALLASAEDADAGDGLTYAWTADAGLFGAPGSPDTTWVAPSSPGVVVLTLTVTDTKGASVVISVSITVTHGTGSAAVNVVMNTWPRVAVMTAMPSTVAVGQTTEVTALASDADGDGLGYQWSADCQGTWTDAASADASFTPSAQPPSGNPCARCRLSVVVTDGRGGQTTGALGICVGTAATARFPPEVVETFQSIASVPAPGDAVTFRVRARDPQGSALSFAWESNVGALGTANRGAVTSEVLWTAPLCLPSGAPPVVTVHVTNALGLSTRASLSLQGGTACAAGHLARIAAGSFCTVALREDGTVLSWGRNYYGQVGDGTTTERLTPGPVHGLSGVVGLAIGEDHALALKQDGTVWGWGGNYARQMGNGTSGHGTNALTPIHLNALTGVTAIVAGGLHSLALKQDGTVWSWGHNEYGQLGEGPRTNSLFPVRVQGLTGGAALAAGQFHSLALKQDGTVWTWGRNAHGQLGDGTTTLRFAPVQVPGLAGVKALGGGYEHSLALKEDGTVWTWGRNDFGQLGDGTTTDRLIPGQVPGLTGVTAIFTGLNHTLALAQDGSVWAWGSNSQGQLGDGTTTNRLTPVRLLGLQGLTPLTSGGYGMFASKQDGTLWAWGSNGNGQLGDGTKTGRSTPVQVKGLGN